MNCVLGAHNALCDIQALAMARNYSTLGIHVHQYFLCAFIHDGILNYPKFHPMVRPTCRLVNAKTYTTQTTHTSRIPKLQKRFVGTCQKPFWPCLLGKDLTQQTVSTPLLLQIANTKESRTTSLDYHRQHHHHALSWILVSITLNCSCISSK